MASAHGAGLMLLPVLLGTGPGDAPAHAHDHGAGSGVAVLAAHTAAMLLATTAAALVAFRLSRIDFLRRAWVDTDAIRAAALAASGVAVLLT